MSRVLPTYTIEGTEFVVDVKNLQLYQKSNPDNQISFSDMNDATGGGYDLIYCPERKNLPSSIYDDVVTAKIPEMVQLDPAGMAEKYGVNENELEGKTDFDLMVDQAAFEKRINGDLPTIDIEGHIFYVDIRMDMLRPKDRFESAGIPLAQIENYYDARQGKYVIPYNPTTKEFQPFDLKQITETPKDLVVISFPHEYHLDPIGANRKHGCPEKFQLKEKNVQSHFKAEKVEWKDTKITQVIKENQKRLEKQIKNTPDKEGKIVKQRRRPNL